ncbi:MAG: hypothetical protein GXX08_04125 [Firmicutes bacterium]|nr:hypothetical protein [Bacillota bacterium]
MSPSDGSLSKSDRSPPATDERANMGKADIVIALVLRLTLYDEFAED